MFSNLGLFSGVPCPDSRCNRRPCLFSHDRSITAEVIEGDEVANKTAARLQARPTGWKAPPAKKQAISLSAPTPYITVPSSSNSASSSRLPTASANAITNSSSSSSSRLPPKPSLNLKIPVLQINSRLSRQPVMDRRKGLERLYDEYKRTYTRILPFNTDLAADHALAEEMAISFSTTVASYSSAVRSACMSIKTREPPKDLGSRFCGTIADVKTKMKKWEEEQKSRLTRDKVKKYVATRAQMEVFGYLYACPPGEGSTHTTCLGERKMCDRCGVDFTVRGPSEQRVDPHPPCVYHWGKATMERLDGVRMQRWSCCGSDRTLNEPGCAVAEFHVFKDGKSWKFSDRRGATDLQAEKREKEEEVEVLHSREGFRSTLKVLREIRDEDKVGTMGRGEGENVIDVDAARGGKRKRTREPHEVVAMDCEMICKPRPLSGLQFAFEIDRSFRLMGKDTSSGMSLARVSVLDAQGDTILDEFVKQTATILDVNEKFSGLTMEDMNSATKDLPEVRREMCRLIDEDTIIIGHGLENDLKSLRLVHRQVIDTAILFPHPKGAPFRRALRDLTSEKLGVFIQNNILEEGHDSGADARAALDLVKWKVRKEDAAPGDFSYA